MRLMVVKKTPGAVPANLDTATYMTDSEKEYLDRFWENGATGDEWGGGENKAMAQALKKAGVAAPSLPAAGAGGEKAETGGTKIKTFWKHFEDPTDQRIMEEGGSGGGGEAFPLRGVL